MNKILSITLLICAGLLLFVSACKNNTDDPDPAYTLTQSELNKSAQTEELDVTGIKYGANVSIPHGGENLTSDETYRDIYSSIGSNGTITKGTIFTKKTYKKNADGSKGPLLVTFAMAKRESGYYANGGDWEYVMMPNDGSNDYGTNPNGTLPPESATEMRGQLAMCASCHAAVSSSDYIFARGSVPPFKATQVQLNAATNPEDLNVTGTKYGEDVSVPHNGMPLSPDSSFRDIYSNIGSQENIDVGTIFTKGTFMRHADGSKGSLQVTFAMIKREEGYYPAGGDFEYVMMPNDGSNDYSTNPNGMLPPESATEMRGQLAMCASCHEKTPSFVFARDITK